MGIVSSPRTAQVIDLDTMRQRRQAQRRILRLSPELDGLEMLYHLTSDPDTLYAMPLLAWGLRESGEVVGLVPWMESLSPCHEVDSPEHGHFFGYRDPETEDIFHSPPEHKVHELEHAAAYFEYEETSTPTLIQQLPDTQGTHALCLVSEGDSWQLKQVFGWRLYNDGRVESLLVDEERIEQTPVLAGDDCLYPGHSRHATVYYFQRHIANQIKQQDPTTLEALAAMTTPSS